MNDSVGTKRGGATIRYCLRRRTRPPLTRPGAYFFFFREADGLTDERTDRRTGRDG